MLKTKSIIRWYAAILLFLGTSLCSFSTLLARDNDESLARYKVEEDELQAALVDLPGWEVKNGKLHKQYKFSSFAAALGWMVSVGVYAEKMDHHPEWFNVYSDVTVDLVTHDMNNAISSWDIALAKEMEQLATNQLNN